MSRETVPPSSNDTQSQFPGTAAALNEEQLAACEALLEELSQYQRRKRRAMADRLKSNVTDDDLEQPHDIPELGSSPLFQYEDGVLAGIETVRMAFRARYRR